MNSEFSNILKPFKIIFIILIIEFLLTFSFFTAYYAKYDKNLFELKVNDKLVKCYYSEKYSSGFIINTSTSAYNDVEYNVNEIEFSNKVYLDIDEYELYYKNGNRASAITDWHKNENLNYKKINGTTIKLQIKRKNKVLYDGDYIKDISEYVNENGRYFIHIYSTRKENLITKVETHISFNFIFGGGNHDEKN